MLNTIYEEFDLQEKIKGLQNKKVKIKRLIKIKGDDSESVLQESTQLGDSTYISDNKTSNRKRNLPSGSGNQQSSFQKENTSPAPFSLEITSQVSGSQKSSFQTQGFSAPEPSIKTPSEDYGYRLNNFSRLPSETNSDLSHISYLASLLSPTNLTLARNNFPPPSFNNYDSSNGRGSISSKKPPIPSGPIIHTTGSLQQGDHLNNLTKNYSTPSLSTATYNEMNKFGGGGTEYNNDYKPRNSIGNHDFPVLIQNSPPPSKHKMLSRDRGRHLSDRKSVDPSITISENEVNKLMHDSGIVIKSARNLSENPKRDYHEVFYTEKDERPSNKPWDVNINRSNSIDIKKSLTIESGNMDSARNPLKALKLKKSLKNSLSKPYHVGCDQQRPSLDFGQLSSLNCSDRDNSFSKNEESINNLEINNYLDDDKVFERLLEKKISLKNSQTITQRIELKTCNSQEEIKETGKEEPQSYSKFSWFSPKPSPFKDEQIHSVERRVSYHLPKDASRLLEEEEKLMEHLKKNISFEKEKLDRELDSWLKELVQEFNSNKKQIYEKFEDYQNQVAKNFDEFRKKIQGQQIKENDKKYNLNDELILNIKGVSFTALSSPFKSKTSAKQLDQDINERVLSYMSDEIRKQIDNYPRYIENLLQSQNIIQDLKKNLKASLSENLSKFEENIQVKKIEPLENLVVIPEIGISISANNLTAMGSFSGTKRPSSQCLKTDHTGTITCILAIDDHKLATGSVDSTIKIWNTLLNRCEATLRGHRGSVKTMVKAQMFPGEIYDNTNNPPPGLYKEWTSSELPKMYLISGGVDFQIIVWDLLQKKAILFLNEHIMPVTSLLCLNDCQTLISSADDRKILIWDCVRERKIVQKIEKQTDSLNYMLLSNSNDRLFTCGNDRMIQVWRICYVFSIEKSRRIFERAYLEKSLFDCSYVHSIKLSSINENFLYSVGSDAKVKLWDLKTGNCEKEVQANGFWLKEFLLMENPHEFASKNRAYMLAAGDEEGLLMIDFAQKRSERLQFEREVKFGKQTNGGPKLQILGEGLSGSVNVAFACQDEGLYYVQLISLC